MSLDNFRDRFLTPEIGYPYIITVCAKQFGLTPETIKSKNRESRVVACRDACVFLMRKLGGSSTSIGRFLQRDHSTILHAAKKVKRFNQTAKQGTLLDKLEREVEFKISQAEWWLAL